MINSKDLLAAVRFCKPALPKPADVRPPLQGVWLTTFDGKLRVEASNGEGLARAHLDVPGLVAGTVLSIRTENLPAVEARLVHGAPEFNVVELQQWPQIDGVPYDFDRVFPQGPATGVPVVGFNAALLANAIKAALLVCHPKNKGVSLTMYRDTAAMLVTIPTRGNLYKSMTDDAQYLVMPMELTK